MPVRRMIGFRPRTDRIVEKERVLPSASVNLLRLRGRAFLHGKTVRQGSRLKSGYFGSPEIETDLMEYAEPELYLHLDLSARGADDHVAYRTMPGSFSPEPNLRDGLRQDPALNLCGHGLIESTHRLPPAGVVASARSAVPSRPARVRREVPGILAEPKAMVQVYTVVPSVPTASRKWRREHCASN